MQETSILHNNFLTSENIDYLHSLLPYSEEDVLKLAVDYARNIHRRDFYYLYDNNNEYIADLELSALNLEFFEKYSKHHVSKPLTTIKKKMLELTFYPKGYEGLNPGTLHEFRKPRADEANTTFLKTVDKQLVRLPISENVKYKGIPQWHVANRYKMPAPFKSGRIGMKETGFIMNGMNQQHLINRYSH